MSDRVESHPDARGEGRFDAAMYLETLENHGTAISPALAAEVLADAMTELMLDVMRDLVEEIRPSGGQQLERAVARIKGFAAVIAESLWECSAARRDGIARNGGAS